jgi:hypothetical protein
MKEVNEISQEIVTKVTEYVNKKYKSHRNKDLIIEETTNCFKIYLHKDGTPLFLGKGVLS